MRRQSQLQRNDNIRMQRRRTG